MPDYSIFVLDERDLTITGAVLDGGNQGRGSHLLNATMVVDTPNWTEIQITDNDPNFQDSDNSQRLNGAQEIDGFTYSSGTVVEAEYGFVLRDPDGNTYEAIGFNVNNSSPVYGTVEGIAILGDPGGFPPPGVPLTVISFQEGPSYNASEYVRPICFTSGTMIKTPSGAALIDTMVAGDEVVCRGGRIRTVRWIGRRRFEADTLANDEKLRPVRITRGALGGGLPKRDLLVSRQHRMLVRSKIAGRMFGAMEVLIPAIKLTEMPGIYVDDDVESVEYVHMLFDRHEVIFAEGAPCETLFTGPEALKAISAEARDEILTIFPELSDEGHAPEAADVIPPGRLQKKLIARHLKNAKPLLADG